jgi:hypothetical protein
VLLLPPLDFLDDCLPDEIPESIVVVIRIDDLDKLVIVSSLDPPGDRYLGKGMLSRSGWR